MLVNLLKRVSLFLIGGGAIPRRRSRRMARYFRPQIERLGRRYVLDGGSLSVGDLVIDEEDGSASFPVTFSGSFSGGFTVNWSTADGTAQSGSDYTNGSGSVNFSGQSETKYIQVAVLDDSNVEVDKYFLLNIGPITGDPNSEIAINDSQATCDIKNTDTAKIKFSYAIGTTREAPEQHSGSHTASFFVRLDNIVNAPVSVVLAAYGLTADAADFNPDETTLNLHLYGTLGLVVPVTIFGDERVELDETIGVELRNLVVEGGLGEFVTIETEFRDLVIENDDQAAFVLQPVGTVDEDAGTIEVEVRLIGAVDVPVTVNWGTQAGTALYTNGDYSPPTFSSAGSLTFPVANGISQTKTFEVEILDDDIVEAATEYFNVWIDTVDADGRDVVIDNGNRAITIADNDESEISISDVPQLEETHAAYATQFVFVVTTSKPIDIAITYTFTTIAVTAIGGVDFTHVATPITVTIQPGQSPGIVISVTADSVDDAANETFEVKLANLTATGRLVSIADDTGIGTIQDDD